MSLFPSFQLLELNIISAQDLAPVSRKTKTYAVAWVHSERKLTTRVDYNGGTNPTWNDKFVFRVNEEFLYADTSAVVIEIYALHWFRDVHVGTVRVLISNLIPPNRRPGYRTGKDEYRRTLTPPGMRFIALQVRRPSGRPQGILNIGVGLIDGSMRSMPLYTNMDSSAVGYRDLLGEEDRHLQHLHLNSVKGSSKNPQSPSSKQFMSVVSRPQFRRTKSDSSSMVVSDLLSKVERSRLATRHPASTLVSETSETEFTTTDSDTTQSNNQAPPSRTPNMQRQLYDPIEAGVLDPSLWATNRESHDDPPYDPYHHSHKTPRKTPMKEKQRPGTDYDRGGRASPYLSRHGTPLRSNIVASTPLRSHGIKSTPMRSNIVSMSPMHPNMVESTPMLTPMRSNMTGSTPKRSNNEGSPPMRLNYMTTPMRSNLAGRRILTESELGPSPSEVAEKLAKDRSNINDTESSILSEWSYDETTVEGLRSKLERWRTELPPLYDLGSSHVSSSDRSVIPTATGGKSSRRKTPGTKKHNRRHTDGGNGLFSCFSKICGVECSFVCGGEGPDESKKGRTGHVHRTLSADDLSFV